MITAKLIKGGQFLDFRSDERITITATGSLVDPEHINRVYSFDFNLPQSPNTNHLLHHIHQIDSSYIDEYGVELFIEGLPFTEGSIDITEISSNNYRANFKSKNRKILDELNYDLATFAKETITFADAPSNITTIPKAETYKLQFTNLNPNAITYHHLYFGNRNWMIAIRPEQTATQAAATMAANINAFLGSRNGIPAAESDGEYLILNSWYNSRSSPANTRIYDLILKDGDNFKVVNITSYDSTVHQHYLSKIDLINRNPESDFVFPAVALPNVKDLKNFKGVINHHDLSTGSILGNIYLPEKSSWNVLVPMLKVKYLINKICERLELRPSGSWWQHQDAQELIIFNTVCLDNYVEYSSPTGKQYLNVFTNTFNPANHLPKMTAKEFLVALCGLFGISMRVKNGKLHFDKKREAYTEISRDFTKYIIPNTLKFEKKKNTGVTIKFDSDSNIIMPDTQLKAFSTKPNASEQKDYLLSLLTLPYSLTSMFYSVPNETYANVKTPQYHGKLNEVSKALLFYRGIQQHSGTLYAYATYDNKTPDNNNNLGYWSLEPSLVYQEHLKNIAELQVAANVYASFEMNIDELIAFERGDYCKIMVYTPMGLLDAVIKQMRVKTSSQALTLIELEMLMI